MRPNIRRILRTAVDAKTVHNHLSRHHAGRIRTAPVSISGSTPASTCPVGKMRNRFHEPRSDPPSPRRLDDVNANKSLYGNKRETPSIRCHEPAPRRGRGRPPRRPDRRGRETGRRPGRAAGRRRTWAGLGVRETTDVGRLDVRETGYIGRAGRLGDGFTSAGPDVRETTDVGRLGVRETGPLAVRDVSGVCRLWHERNGCFPGCKRSETPVGRQDGPRRAGGTAADL